MRTGRSLFGEIAVQLKLLSRAQLAEALHLQLGASEVRQLGQICIDLGYLRPAQVTFILEQQKKLLARTFGKPRAARSRRPPPDRATPSRRPRSIHELPMVRGDSAEHAAARGAPADGRSVDEMLRDYVRQDAAEGSAPSQVERSSEPEARTPSTGRDTEKRRPHVDQPEPAPGRPDEPARPPSPEPALAGTETASAPRRPGQIKVGEGILSRAIGRAAALGASDLHVHSGAPLLVRCDGQLRPLEQGDHPMDAEAAGRAIAELLGEECWQQLLEVHELDLAIQLPGGGRCRLNAYMQQRGPDIVLRLLSAALPTIESLGLPDSLVRLTRFRTGMVLCTGPTGCGKSTTLSALLNLIIASRREHVITLEDPIERLYPDGVGLVNQRQIGDHSQSFARALRAALREDPDVIAITELRDSETISLAMSAAETGHLVLGSLHTGDAVQTISRIINAFPADQQAQVRAMLSESLRAVVSQRLVRRRDGKGRVPVLEVLLVTSAVANLIREDKSFQIRSAMQLGRARGMVLLDDALDALVRAGTIAAEDARRHAIDPGRFAEVSR